MKNLQHTVMGAVFWSEPTVSFHADLDAYDSIVERVMLRGVRVNRAPERALMLAPPPLCPCCFTNVYFTARTPPPLDVAVACGHCGWSGVAGQVLECS